MLTPAQVQDAMIQKVQPFFYRFRQSITASSTESGVLNLQSDALFEWHSIMGESDKDAETDRLPRNFEFKMTIQSSGHVLMNGAIPQSLIAPTSQNNGTGLRLPRPVFLPPNTNIDFEVTDLNASGANQVTIVLYGLKHYGV